MEYKYKKLVKVFNVPNQIYKEIMKIASNHSPVVNLGKSWTNIGNKLPMLNFLYQNTQSPALSKTQQT
jgi:hypothetical protein